MHQFEIFIWVPFQNFSGQDPCWMVDECWIKEDKGTFQVWNRMIEAGTQRRRSDDLICSERITRLTFSHRLIPRIPRMCVFMRCWGS